MLHRQTIPVWQNQENGTRKRIQSRTSVVCSFVARACERDRHGRKRIYFAQVRSMERLHPRNAVLSGQWKKSERMLLFSIHRKHFLAFSDPVTSSYKFWNDVIYASKKTRKLYGIHFSNFFLRIINLQRVDLNCGVATFSIIWTPGLRTLLSLCVFPLVV